MAKKRKAGLITVVVVGLLAIGAVNSCVQSLSNAGSSDSSDTTFSYDLSSPGDDQAATDDELDPTPSPLPAPDIVITEHTGQAANLARTELVAQGLVPIFVDASGSPVPDATGWSVASETPVTGTVLSPGMVVRLTVTPPAPAPPAVSPPQPAPPVPDQGGGATAKCNDGTLSYSAHHQGTCSHHRGVAVWYR